jgi:hypothetical protein
VNVDLSQPTLGADEMAQLFGYSAWFVYQHADEMPVAPIRVGRKLRWPTAPVLRVLGIESAGHETPLRAVAL